MTLSIHAETGGTDKPHDALASVKGILARAKDFACLCRNGAIVMFNDAALSLIGKEALSAENLIGEHFTAIVHGDDAWSLTSWWENTDAKQSLGLGERRHCRIGSAQHGWRHVELTRAFHASCDDQFEIILGRTIENFRITGNNDTKNSAGSELKSGSVMLRRERVKRKWAERKVRRLAYQDHLTGLINRVYFQLRLKNALRGAEKTKKSIVLMFIDIDRFKDVNDIFGHTTGDQLLQHIAARLKSGTRANDTIARMGGDEFAIIAHDLAGAPNKQAVAQKILNLLSGPFLVNEHSLHVGSSIGVTSYPDDGTDIEVLQKNASLALNHAKQTGAGQIQIFDPEMNAQVRMRKRLEDELNHAIQNDQLIVHYQPKIEIATGVVTGIEALVRWQHPERGLISPALFIPLAEASGLIMPMTELVMRTSCKDLMVCHAMQLQIGHVSVNLSANLVQIEDLAGIVKRILEETQLPVKHLELEITESILMEDIDKAQKVLNSLYLLGVSLSLDDFGTGYSSLTYLRQFPFRTLKIDRSFITDMSDNSEDIAIVRAVIALAHSLKLRVVAEGVEKEEQLQILKLEGCDEVQGFYYSKPLPVNELIKWMNARHGGHAIRLSD